MIARFLLPYNRYSAYSISISADGSHICDRYCGFFLTYNIRVTCATTSLFALVTLTRNSGKYLRPSAVAAIISVIQDCEITNSANKSPSTSVNKQDRLTKKYCRHTGFDWHFYSTSAILIVNVYNENHH